MMYGLKMFLFISIYHHPTPFTDESVLPAWCWLHGKFWTLDLLQGTLRQSSARENNWPSLVWMQRGPIEGKLGLISKWFTTNVSSVHYKKQVSSYVPEKDSGTFQDLTPHHRGWFCRLIVNSLRKILRVITMMLGMRGVTIWMKGQPV